MEPPKTWVQEPSSFDLNLQKTEVVIEADILACCSPTPENNDNCTNLNHLRLTSKPFQVLVPIEGETSTPPTENPVCSHDPENMVLQSPQTEEWQNNSR